MKIINFDSINVKELFENLKDILELKSIKLQFSVEQKIILNRKSVKDAKTYLFKNVWQTSCLRQFMKNNLISLLLLLLLSFASGQEISNETYFEYSKNTIQKDVKQAFNLGLGFIKAPFNLESNDWLLAAGSLSITATLFIADPHVKTFVLNNRSKFSNEIFKIDGIINGTSTMYLSAGFYLTGFVFKQEKIRTIGLHSLEALFIASSITSVLKYTFGRRRPYAGDDQMDFKLFRGTKNEFKAFPSGHTTSAFALASVMAMSIDNIYWKSAWYSSATLVGMARIYNNKHWLSDTFFAALISYSVAHYVVNFEEEKKDKSLSISPSLNGVGINYSF